MVWHCEVLAIIMRHIRYTWQHLISFPILAILAGLSFHSWMLVLTWPPIQIMKSQLLMYCNRPLIKQPVFVGMTSDYYNVSLPRKVKHVLHWPVFYGMATQSQQQKIC